MDLGGEFVPELSSIKGKEQNMYSGTISVVIPRNSGQAGKTGKGKVIWN